VNEAWFDVELDVERLLGEWKWLCAEPVKLVARNVFGDRFLREINGTIFRRNAAAAKRTKVANSEVEFRELARRKEMRDEWFAETDELAAASRGLMPNKAQCIGFTTPLVFQEAGQFNSPYVTDLYEYVSFLGDLNRQLSVLPDGAKVRLKSNLKIWRRSKSKHSRAVGPK